MDPSQPATLAPGVPPATGQPNTLVYPFKMKVEPGRVKGKVSDFRQGDLIITPAGIRLDGKVLMPLWKRNLFTLLAAPTLYGMLVVALVVNHLIRYAGTLELPWDCVDEVVMEPRKNRICLVYHLPESPTRPLSLAFYLQPAMFQYFGEVARYWARGKVREGVIGPPESPWISIAVLVIFLLMITALIIAFSMDKSGGQ